MKRVIVDFNKLTEVILDLLVEKFPDGYGIRDIIKFTNHKGQYIEAIEVSTQETIYLVKISSELVESMQNYDEKFSQIGADLEIDDISIDDDEIVIKNMKKGKN